MSELMVEGPDEITAAWLDRVLAGAGFEATVDSVATRPVGTGQMASCVRVEVAYSSGSGPATLVVKLPAADVADRARSGLGYRCEVGFYREVAPKLGDEVPRVHLAETSDEGAAFTIVMEDLSPHEQGDQIAGCDRSHALVAAVTAARVHAVTWCDPGIRRFGWTIPFATDPDAAAFLAAVLDDATTSFLDRIIVAPATAEVMRRFVAVAEPWLNGRWDRTALIHGDFRLDNLLFAPSLDHARPVVAVDWQTASVGRPLSDVAFLVAGGMDPPERREAEREVVGAYHRELGVDGYDLSTCWDDYRYALLHPLMITVLGALVSRQSDRGDLMFATMARRIAAAVTDLHTFEMLP